MSEDFFKKLKKSIRKPIIPKPPKEDRFSEIVSFPDKDATEEEIKEFLNK